MARRPIEKKATERRTSPPPERGPKASSEAIRSLFASVNQRRRGALRAIRVEKSGPVELIPRKDRSGSKPWPFAFRIPAANASDWLHQLDAECRRRGWTSHVATTMGRAFNSGERVISTSQKDPSPTLIVVWNRHQSDDMSVHARPSSFPLLPRKTAKDFFQAVQRARPVSTERFWRRGALEYFGRPWLGELWLSERLRLGPPTLQCGSMGAPKVILVDELIPAIDFGRASEKMGRRLRELSLFLGVILRTAVQQSGGDGRHVWTFDVQDGKAITQLQQMGYADPRERSSFPQPGEVAPVGLVAVDRPDLSVRALHSSVTEEPVPADFVDLWKQFEALSARSKEHFLRAANAWQLASSLSSDHSTAGLSFMVVAIECLKPDDQRFDYHSFLHVIEGLLGRELAEAMNKVRLPSAGKTIKQIRDQHLHRGLFFGPELSGVTDICGFHDFSFELLGLLLKPVVPAAIIAWLQCGGDFKMPDRERPGRPCANCGHRSST